jgi:ribonuclease HI
MPRRQSEILTPAQVLARYQGGPRSGVFTDGSCEGNPGPGGWGVVWVEDDQIRAERWGADPATTNNRMELTALITAYRLLPEDLEITVFSDSQLCVKTINEWAAGWERRGWRRARGPIANLELVKELYALAGSHPRARLHWIRAHDGSRWNEYADALATAYLRDDPLEPA